jgi:hypothetical protein
MPTELRHAVGNSTLKEGFAIPRTCEEWIHAPERGEKREIRLIFEDNEIQATLRRIDNEKGSVQVKYENKAGESFRTWLSRIFVASLNGPCGEYFEVSRVDDYSFRITPFPTDITSGPRLQVEQWLFHGGSEKLFEHPPIAEISAIIRAVSFENEKGQSYFNRAISGSFHEWDWHSESRVIPDLGLKCDFSKDRVQVEVEFGNARTYYQDYMKFLLANHYGNADVGVLIVPTGGFARHLCGIGRLRAVEKGRSNYSGMIDFDKVHREFEYLKFMMVMPIAIAAIGFTSQR